MMENDAKHVGAVGSALAAEVYGINVAAHSIQQDATNQTRFWVIAKSGQPPQSSRAMEYSALKATVSFETSHETGALADALQAVKSNGWNLTKIESRPVPDVPWRYRFFCDMELEPTVNVDEIESSLHALEQAKAMQLSRVLGVYRVYAF